MHVPVHKWVYRKTYTNALCMCTLQGHKIKATATETIWILYLMYQGKHDIKGCNLKVNNEMRANDCYTMLKLLSPSRSLQLRFFKRWASSITTHLQGTALSCMLSASLQEKRKQSKPFCWCEIQFFLLTPKGATIWESCLRESSRSQTKKK